MKILNKIKLIALLLFFVPLAVLIFTFFSATPKVSAATTKVNLLTADNFAVLAGAAVADANLSVIVGDVGLSPASGSFIGVTCAEVTGAIYSVDGSGPLPCRITNPGLLTQAKNDLTTAFTDAGGRSPATTLPGGDNQLGGQTLTAGVYSFSHATTANLIGTVTLNGQGDPNAVFILQASSDLITASSSTVALTNGAQACNVFWQVPTSATFGTGSNFVGTVMADQSITDNGGSTVNGRFLARIATVTVNNTHITKPTCAAAAASSSSSSSSPSSAGTSVCVASPITTIPTILESRRVSPTSIFVSWGPDAGLSDFVVQYGFQNGNWQFNTKVSGFSTTINDLPANQPIWIQVAAANNCAVGTYGASMLVGGILASSSTLIPRLPNTGIGPDNKNIPWNIALSVGILILVSASLVIAIRKRAI